MEKDDDQFAEETRALLQTVMPMFAGIDPDVVGGALSYLVATWISGHRNDELRKEARAGLDTATDKTIKFLDDQYEKHKTAPRH